MYTRTYFILSLLLILLQSSNGCHYDPDKYSVGLFAASALNKDGVREPCMGTCYGTEKNTCRLGTKTKDDGNDCNTTDELLIRYNTKYFLGKTNLCISDCNNFGYRYSWCVTEDHWRKCIKEIPRNVTRKVPASTKYEYYHCLEGCLDNGQCDIYPKSKENCDPSKVVYVSDNPTDAGTRCATRCGMWSTNKFKCYDTRKKWVKCYPSPDGTKIVKSFHQYAKKFKQQFDESGRLLQSEYTSIRQGYSNLIDVDDNDILKLESILSDHNVVEEMAKRLEAIYTTETLHQHQREEPILQYTVRIVPTAFDQPQIILPMVVKARYSSFTRAKAKSSSTDYAIVNYRNQNPRPGLDDLGYIVPRDLGGTEEPHNIIPLWVGLKQGGPWASLEHIINNYIATHPGGTVDHTVVINYDFTMSYRPMSFAICVRFFDANRNLVDKDGKRLNSYSNNIYDAIYLINSAVNDI